MIKPEFKKQMSRMEFKKQYRWYRKAMKAAIALSLPEFISIHDDLPHEYHKMHEEREYFMHGVQYLTRRQAMAAM